MTDEQINQRIAEACGLICLHEFQANKDGAKFGYWEYPKNWTGPKKQPWCLDFCHDLNAMHEAESILDEDCQNGFRMELLNVTGSKYFGGFDHIHATARQRAEAFLRTLDKWDDQSGERTEKEAQL